MRVSQVCTQDVVCVASDCTVRAAAETMRTRHVGSVVVIDGRSVDDVGNAPIGLLTDRDIVVAVVAPGILPDVVTVADVMSLPLYTIEEDADLVDAIHRMREKAVRRLVVTNRAGGLAGILAMDDAYEALTGQLSDLQRAVDREQVREATLRG
jgi:CBS domain-containing protein